VTDGGATVTVTLRLHAELARYAPPETRGTVTLALPGGARVADALARLNLPPRRRIIVGLNGENAGHDAPLRDGDHLDLVTPMSGGAPYYRRP
jgi:sulfur carrier protein ThiS